MAEAKKTTNQKQNQDEKISKLREEIADMRFDIRSANLEVLEDYRAKKKELARELTIINQQSERKSKSN
ncbi:hypothetical protein GF389_01885 [Candidatus Dojkabacteria bacterium]|nr:hypothetical protein [Candidatus Dojkabacteria bacterium]